LSSQSAFTCAFGSENLANDESVGADDQHRLRQRLSTHEEIAWFEVTVQHVRRVDVLPVLAQSQPLINE
jgi:hypothetical protein